MGIRFYCPNGHKLNVKAEQAGKTGFCPKCGVKVQIPLESTRTSHHHHENSGEQPEVQTAVKSSELQPEAQPAPAEPTPSSVPAPEIKLAEEGWHIQGGDGKDYGPVSLATIRSWIAEHRVCASTLVWIPGWSEWRTAESVFSEFQGSSLPPVQPAPGVPNEQQNEIDALRQATRGTESKTIERKKLERKKQRARRDLFIVIGLTAAIVVLLGVLIFLLRK